MNKLTIPLTTVYFDGLVNIVKDRYSNGRVALLAFDPGSGEPIMKLTVNLPDVVLEDNEVAIKDYSENEGALECLINSKIVSSPLAWISLNYVRIPICQLLI